MRESDEPERIKGAGPPDGAEDAQPAGAGDEPVLGSEFQAIEAAWARLRPRDARIDRDRLVYHAGWAAAEAALGAARSRRTRLAWPAALGGMTAIAATLLGMLLVRPEPAVVERVVFVSQDVDEDSNALREFAQNRERGGVDAQSASAQRVWTVGRLLRPGDAASAARGDDLLPLETTPDGEPRTTPGDLESFENLKVLSSRSVDSLLYEKALSASGPIPPTCITPSM